jgi:hypothetical protein
MEAVILSVPRVAPVRPAAAPAIIKGIFNQHNKQSRILDLNLDFFTEFKDSVDDAIFTAVDDFLFVESKTLTETEDSALDLFCQKWIERIKELDPRLLFLSVFSWQAQKFTEYFLTRLRNGSTVEVIIGGQGLIKEENGSFSTKPTFAHYLKEKNLIDHWIRGEAETTIPEIIKGNYDVQGIDTDTLAERSEVKEHPYMDFDDFDINKYQSGYEDGVLPMETSRGCLRKCVFCDIPNMQGGFRFKTGQQLADEMIHYYEKYNVRHYFFHDALCNGSPKDFRIFNQALVDYYEKHGLPDRYFRYSSHAIVYSEKHFKPKDFELMGRGGAETMVIGVESGSDRVREHMKKGFTGADLDYNMEQYSKWNIQVYFLVIVGFPTETEEDFQETLDMLTKYQRYVADGTVIGVNLGTTLTMEEGTEMYEKPETLNIIGVDGKRPKGTHWIAKGNESLTYKERIMRRIKAQEHAVDLGYTFWKGDDQMKIMMDKYQRRLIGVIH